MTPVFKRYGFWGSLRLCRDLILTKILFSAARLVRYPVYIRGRQFISFGKDLTTGVGMRIDAFPVKDMKGKKVVTFGSNVEINDYVHIGAIESVVIGNNVLIASKVFISDHNHGSYSGVHHSSPDSSPGDRPLFSKPVIIEDNVWLGESVMVLPGVVIGAGSIIGASSVVTKSIPPGCIAVGLPATVVKKYNSSTRQWETVAR
jgi:lipopolysaccharide O-acetyltransferase